MSVVTVTNDSLLRQAVEMGHHRDDEEAVTEALREYIASIRRRELVKLIGKVEYATDYDYKQDRKKS